MAVDIPAVAGGAAIGAVASDVYQKSKDKASDVVGVPGIEHGPIELQMIVETLAELHEMAKQAFADKRDPQFAPISLFGQPQSTGVTAYKLERRGYKHISLLTAVAFTIDCLTQIGPIKFAMSVGWNALDVPDGTELWHDTLTGTNYLPVILYKGEDSLDIAGV